MGLLLAFIPRKPYRNDSHVVQYRVMIFGRAYGIWGLNRRTNC